MQKYNFLHKAENRSNTGGFFKKYSRTTRHIADYIAQKFWGAIDVIFINITTKKKALRKKRGKKKRWKFAKEVISIKIEKHK